MIIDFHNHYTPPELMEDYGERGALRLDERGNPNYRFNSLLVDLAANVRMMDRAGIDAAVLSCGSGFDQPNLATCRLINDRMRQAELDYPGRFVGLAHVPALNAPEAAAELKRCAVDLGFPGVAIASELQGQALDAEALRPFWKAAVDLGLYVFIHPLPRVIDWRQMDVDDLGRMLGWEFSLMVATVRIINSGLLDALPALRIHLSHFAGGIGRYLPRILGLQQREDSGTARIPRHSRRPVKPFDDYLRQRIFFDCAGWSGRSQAAKRGADWDRMGLTELPATQVVFGTDFPQAVSDECEVAAYVHAVRTLGIEAKTVLYGPNARNLIPDIEGRLKPQVIQA